MYFSFSFTRPKKIDEVVIFIKNEHLHENRSLLWESYEMDAIHIVQ